MDWPEITPYDLKNHIPFRAENQHYLSQTEPYRPELHKFILVLIGMNLFLSAFLLALWAFLHSVAPEHINGVLDFLLYLVSKIPLFIFCALNLAAIFYYMQHYWQIRHLNRFYPPTLYADNAPQKHGSKLEFTFYLRPPDAKIGITSSVCARIFCEEATKVQRGTDTVTERHTHWSEVLPMRQFSADAPVIHYPIAVMPPAGLPPTLKGLQHSINWYIQMRLQFGHAKPIYLLFPFEVTHS